MPTPSRQRIKLVVEARFPLQRSGLLTYFVHTRSLETAAAHATVESTGPVPVFYPFSTTRSVEASTGLTLMVKSAYQPEAPTSCATAQAAT